MKSSILQFLTLVLVVFSIAKGADRPNIVWLVSEDNAAEYLKLYNPHGVTLPNIESLAAQGLIFDHAFSNAPVCSVARSTLISGCYAPRVGAQFHRRLVKVPLPSGLKMFPTYLREAGYYCTNNSKQDYNFEANPGVWDQSSNRASYQNRKPGQPFFHVQNYAVTHESSMHFKSHKYSEKRAGSDADGSAVPPYLPDSPLARFTHEAYLKKHLQLDQQIGQFIAQLKSENLLEDTIIFYFGDHGGVLPRSKGYIYESGLHVPLVVAIPDQWKHLSPGQAGDRVKGFVSFVDFAPTVLHLAGVEVPGEIDGRPFLGKGVERNELDQRDKSYGYADRFDEKYDLVRSIRRGKFKYIRSYQPFNPDLSFNDYRYRQLLYQQWKRKFDAGELSSSQAQFFKPRSPEALYDLDADPFELKNLAIDPSHRSTLLSLRGELATWVKAMPDLSFYPESELIESAWKNPVAFGQLHKREIGELVDIADLSLIPFTEAAPALKVALGSENPWKRYWALVACSCFGEEAAEWASTIAEITTKDSEPLVRMRAAEFLGISGTGDPVPLLATILEKSESDAEALLILNSIAILHDGPKHYKFPKSNVTSTKGSGQLIKDRLRYLSK